MVKGVSQDVQHFLGTGELSPDLSRQHLWKVPQFLLVSKPICRFRKRVDILFSSLASSSYFSNLRQTSLPINFYILCVILFSLCVLDQTMYEILATGEK